jgi:hypothetical protein
METARMNFEEKSARTFIFLQFYLFYSAHDLKVKLTKN